MTEVQITHATFEQTALVHQIMQAAFAEYLGVLYPPSSAHAETVDDVRAAMHKGGALLAWLDGAAVGSARFEFRPPRLYVGRISVLPEQRGTGIATAMLHETEVVARQHELAEIEMGVRVSLAQNIALYQRLGYEVVRVEPHPRSAPDRAEMSATLIKKLHI